MSHIPYYNETQSRSGYELRTELVDIVANYMLQQQKIYAEAAEAAYKNSSITTAAFLEAAKPLSIQDLLESTQQLYCFVTSK